MTAMWARPRAPPAPSASAKVFIRRGASRRACLLREFPSFRRQRTHQRGFRRGVCAGGGAIAHASNNSLKDRGNAEEIVSGINRKIGAGVETGPPHISFDVIFKRRNSERGQIVADQRAGSRLRRR